MKHLILFFICGLITTTSGCASKNAIVIWQENLTNYIVKNGNGDPNVLRDTVDMHSQRIQRPARITFGGLLTDPRNPWFSKEVDANGVLVGVRKIESHNWYLFLVGISREPSSDIEDVRLTGFTNKETEFLWRVAEKNQDAVDKYLLSLPEQTSGVAFPSERDVFKLEVSGPVVSVTENNSGAVWQLNLENSE